MSERTRIIRVGRDRMLPGLFVVGYHGQLGHDQTPARRGSILADAEGRIVEIVEVRPARTRKRELTEGYEVSVQAAGHPPKGGEFPGFGTRIGPWPARLADYVVILGAREKRHASGILQGMASGEPARVRDFLQWVAGSARRSEELACERVEDLVAWYCVEDEAFCLWQRIQDVARKDLLAAARRSDPGELRDTAFWLSRAAIDDTAIYLAVAGLRRAGYPHWQTVLKEGISGATDEARRAGLEHAAELLERPPLARGGGLHPAVEAQRRRSIDASFDVMDSRAA